MQVSKKHVILTCLKFVCKTISWYTTFSYILMRQTLLHQLAIFFVAVGTFLSAASFAQANTFSFPQSYNYAGLTFADSLTFTRPLSIPQPTTAITFSSQHKLLINKNNAKKSLESIVLTPTVTLETTDSPDIAQPTPTIYLQPTTPTNGSGPTATALATQDQSVSPTPTPTIIPATTAISTTPSYTPTAQSNPGGLNADDLFSMVNTYRASQGLPAFQQDAKTCSLAQERAPAIAGEVASGNMHAGLIAMNLPYWNTENIISMNSDQAAFNWWINDPIHHAAIVSSATYSCVACSGNSCAEEFTSYQPK
jgi:uncharacterized protein YkwD